MALTVDSERPVENDSVISLRYGHTNTYFLRGSSGTLLVDTDMAGTLPLFYKAMKKAELRVSDISYVMATHYHPDHMGLISELMSQGVRLLLIEGQKDFVHFSDPIYQKEKRTYVPIEESRALLLSSADSRLFLRSLGISGEIIETPSHSPDSVSLVLDKGEVLAGDLEPYTLLEGYEDNESLRLDWQRILSFRPEKVWFSHRPPMKVR